MHACVHATYVYPNMHTHTCVHIHFEHLYIQYIYIHMSVYTYTYIYTHSRCTHTYTLAYTNIHTHDRWLPSSASGRLRRKVYAFHERLRGRGTKDRLGMAGSLASVIISRPNNRQHHFEVCWKSITLKRQ